MAARVISIFKTLRNNWKKSTFAAGLVFLGGRYAKKKYDEEDMRRQFCREAVRYGTQYLSRMDKPLKVTVILNPMAKHGKAKKLFEKNVAPLLYLAGFEVAVVKTEHEGQAKQYMDVLEDTDYIVVAGGDGTLQEVVTGLLRRKDQKLSHVPIGVIPLGVVNSFASSLFGDREKELVSWLLDAGMSVVKGLVKPTDVLSITSQEEKTVYAMSGVDCGIMRKAIDRVNKKQKYWYLGGLKHRVTLIRTALANIQSWPPDLDAEVTYTNTCNGCGKCRPVPEWRWWHILFKPKIEDFSKVMNSDCGVEHSRTLSGLHMVINSPAVRERQIDSDTGINVHVMPTMDVTEFMKHGMSLIGIKPYADIRQLRERITDIQTVKFTPLIEKKDEPFYSIDNEDFEGMPITVSLLKNRIRVFAPYQGVS